jgi:hypothetical protein
MKCKIENTIIIETPIDIITFNDLLHFQLFKSLKIINVGNIAKVKKSKNITKIVELFISSKIICWILFIERII